MAEGHALNLRLVAPAEAARARRASVAEPGSADGPPVRSTVGPNRRGRLRKFKVWPSALHTSLIVIAFERENDQVLLS